MTSVTWVCEDDSGNPIEGLYVNWHTKNDGEFGSGYTSYSGSYTADVANDFGANVDYVITGKGWRTVTGSVGIAMFTNKKTINVTMVSNSQIPVSNTGYNTEKNVQDAVTQFVNELNSGAMGLIIIVVVVMVIFIFYMVTKPKELKGIKDSVNVKGLAEKVHGGGE